MTEPHSVVMVHSRCYCNTRPIIAVNFRKLNSRFCGKFNISILYFIYSVTEVIFICYAPRKRINQLETLL